MFQWISFDEALELSQNQERNLLIGNGFSISASDTFNYKTLFSVTDFSKIGAAQNLFISFGTYDFEKIIDYLDISSKVLDTLYDFQRAKSLTLLKSQLITEFIHAIIRIHPDNLYQTSENKAIQPSNFANNAKFLANFLCQTGGNIFTVNYDLLLYWSLLEGMKNETLSHIADGFASFNSGNKYLRDRLYWDPQCSANIFYLHGALHLRKDYYGGTYKINYSPDTALLSRTHHDLRNSIYPLIVFEGSDPSKRIKIQNDKYLSMCMSRLCNIQGSIFTYGFSFSDNDGHIARAISCSKISNIYIGIYADHGDDQRVTNEIQKAIISFKNKEKNVYLFSTKNLTIW